MIPLKEQTTQSETLCFRPADSEALARCVDAVRFSGGVVISVATHEGLLSHYTRTLINELKQTHQMIRIRRMANDKDSLLAALNKRLAGFDTNVLSKSRRAVTAEVWLYELPGPADTGLLRMAAKMVRQFEAAGVSLVVHSRQARAESARLRELSSSLNATFAEFPTPTAEEAKDLLERTRGLPEASQIQQLVGTLGLPELGSSDKPGLEAEVKPFASPKLGSQAINELSRRNEQQAAAVSKPKTQSKRRRANMVAISSLVASAMIASAYISQDPQVLKSFSDSAEWIDSQWSRLTAPAAAADASEVISATTVQSDTVAGAAAVESAETSSEAGTATDKIEDSSNAVAMLQAGANTAVQKAVVQTAAVEEAVAQQISAEPRLAEVVVLPVIAQDDATAQEQTPPFVVETLVSQVENAKAAVPLEPEQDLKALFAEEPAVTASKVVTVPAPLRERISPVEDTVYVQHASFRSVERAKVWRVNAQQLPNVRLFAKGDLFVVVSGPFVDRGQARAQMQEYGMNGAQYFIRGSDLDRPVAE